jgi:hypothetical protein
MEAPGRAGRCQRQPGLLRAHGAEGRGGGHRVRVRGGRALHQREVDSALPEPLRADLHSFGAGSGHLEDRLGGHGVQLLQRPVHGGAAVCLARPHQRRARGLERGDHAAGRQREELQPHAPRARAALRDRRRVPGRRAGPVGQLGRRRLRARPRQRPVLRARQTAPAGPQGALLRGVGAAEHPALAAGAAGDLPGRLVGRGHRPGGQVRGRGVHALALAGGHAQLPAPGEGQRGGAGPPGRRREDLSRHRPRGRPPPRRRPRPSTS